MSIKSIKFKWATHQKRWFGKWHLYLGIIAGAVLCVIGLTGSILVFGDEIDRAFNKDLYNNLAKQKRYSIEEIADIVKKKYPKKHIDYVYLSKVGDPNISYTCYNFATEEQFFINPYTAEITGSRVHHTAFIGFITDLHISFFIPGIGQYIVGIATLCLLILTISGFRLWVPQQYKKWKHWKSVMTVNFKASFKRQNYDWHNVLGFYSSPIVILLSLTGVAITFAPLFIAALFLLSGRSPQSIQQIFAQKSAYMANAKPLNAVEIGRIGKHHFPNAVIRGLAFPSDSSTAYRLDMQADGVSKEGKRIMLGIDQYNGKILLNSEKDFPNIGHSYLTWIVPLHVGSFGGLPTKILAFIGGLIPLLLFVTGFIIWWPRYKKQSDKAAGIPTKPTKSDKALQAIKELKYGNYFAYYFKKGLKYAVIVLVAAAVSGALYGAISGIILEPAAFTILYSGIAVAINLLIAILVFMLVLMVGGAFRKNIRPIFKYLAYSLSFAIIFLPPIIAISILSKNFF